MTSKEEAKQYAVKKYTMLWVLTLLQFAGFGPMSVLQSSINIEQGTGVWSLMVTYVGGALFNLLFTPILLRKLGPRKTMYLAQLTYLIYCLANFYPKPFILIPAGLIVGIGEACFWPSAILFTMHYARCFSRAGPQSAGQYTTQFLGILFSGLSLSGILGNLLTWGILYSGSSHEEVTNATTNATIDVSVCGTADCQAPDVTEANIEQYEPGSPAAFYGTVSTLTALVMVSVVISVLTIPEIDESKEYSEDDEEEDSFITVAETKDGVVIVDRKEPNRPPPKKEEFSACEGIQKMLQHLISGKQLLLTPYALYSGAHLAFFFSEMTRSYVSCLRGVAQVGLFVMVGAIANGFASPVVGMISATCGRNIPMLFGYVLDVSKYVLLLFWTPSLDDTWLVFVIAVAEGMVDGVLQLSAQDIHGSFFPRKREFAVSAVNMYNTLGWGIIYAISTSLCMYIKIYIMIGWATAAILGYAIVGCVYKNDLGPAEIPLPQKDDDDENVM